MNERFTGDQHLIDGTGDGGRAVESMLDELDGESPDKGKPSPLGTALLELCRKLVKPKTPGPQPSGLSGCAWFSVPMCWR